MLSKDKVVLDYSIDHKEEIYLVGNKKQDSKDNQIGLVAKSSDNKSLRNMLFGRIPQDGLFACQLSSSLREIRFSEQKFPVNKPVLDIKYHHPDFQNNNVFYPLDNSLHYALANTHSITLSH